MTGDHCQDTIIVAYRVGDVVRVTQVPPYLYTDNPVDQDVAHMFELCLRHEFRVEAFDEHGQLELWVTDEGKQAADCLSHTIWIEPEFVELAAS